ncbi:MAG: hypothetical protein EP335_06785 [Alphaproteobacteria bacterium]|nr:MAG: hypothetical protein EP335_06785 [Alphaproteobacteria bacterium]
MVDINTNASALQTRLQAQLQSKPGRSSANLTPRPQDLINDRAEERSSSSKRLPALQSGNANTLSSQSELEEASARVADFGANRREAPIGRLSTQASQRNVPLGQIVDIRV